MQWTALDNHSVASIVALGDGNDEGAHLVFRNTSTASSDDPYAMSERMRIDSSGNVLIATTSSTAPHTLSSGQGLMLNASRYISLARSSDCLFLNRTGSNGGVARFYRSGGTDVGSISVTTSSTSYNTSSDYRLKENVVDMTGAQ